MHFKHIIYFFFSNSIKTILSFTLIIAALRAQGQVDADYDSTVNIIEEGVKEITPSDNTTTANSQFFLYRWQDGSDSFTIQQRNVPDNRVKEMKDNDDFWYANTDIKKEKPELKSPDYKPLGGQSWFQTLLWLIIIGGFAAAIMWYLASNNVGLFRKRSIETPNDVSDEIPEDIFAINYQKEIEKAAAQGNYRLAVRLMFLRVLKKMAEKNIIHYKQDKTNFDYLLQLQPTAYYSHFFRITRNYEYSWYGMFQVSEDAYKIIRSDFDQFDRQLR